MDATIYGIINLVNNNYYVGSTARPFHRRRNNHTSALNRGNHYSSHLQRAWIKYGPETFMFFVIEECPVAEQFIRETYWIRRLAPKYNTAPVGGSVLGIKQSHETRKKHADAIQGIKRSEETKKKLAAVQTIERRAAMRALKLGKPMAPGVSGKVSAGVKKSLGLEPIPSFSSPTHKECTQCHTIKPRSEFYKTSRGVGDPNHPHCKECQCAKKRAQYQANPEPFKARTRARNRVKNEFSKMAA